MNEIQLLNREILSLKEENAALTDQLKK